MIPASTIVAQATPSGRGGVGIVRLSGPLSYPIALSITQRKCLMPRYAHYGSFYDPAGQVLDEGLCLWFPQPHSFTGEDVVEFQAHGGPIVMQLIITECLGQGAVLAKPGEFSERAFLNDKLDLAGSMVCVFISFPPCLWLKELQPSQSSSRSTSCTAQP